MSEFTIVPRSQFSGSDEKYEQYLDALDDYAGSVGESRATDRYDGE